MALNLRQIEIYKPYDNEVPELLLVREGATRESVEAWENAPFLRVAKIGPDVLGTYAMSREDTDTFVLHGVVVEPGVRQQGLGRWLTGHAIGVAESKGGRRVMFRPITRLRLRTGMFRHMGFVEQPGGLGFDLIPE